jgi:hypothetical protein
MVDSIKQLIIVLAIATVVFQLARPIALHFTTRRDYARRRNVWLLLTIAAFLSPNFWPYALLAVPLFIWAGRKDSNPVAFYLLLLHVIPGIPVEIPTVGIQELFALDNFRLLSLCVLVPAAWKLRSSRPANQHGMLTSMDLMLLGFGLVQILLYVPPDIPNHVPLPDSFTNLLRRAFLFFIDVYVVYYVVSRSCLSRRAINEAMATFCLACAIMAMQAVFESLRHWLLYMDMVYRWGGNPINGYTYVRNGILRAQASAGAPLALGSMLAIAIGFWMYLQSQVSLGRWRVLVFLVFWAGLLATFSRGDWIGAALIYFAFTALGPRALPRTLRATAIAAVLVAVMSLTPFGEHVLDSLPGLGVTTNSGSLAYRERLAERSWQLFQQHPLFGDQLALSKMQDLRQGEQIIDLVNTYAEIALFYGAIGLALFMAFILSALVRTYWQAKSLFRTDPGFGLLGVSLAACIVGLLLMILDNSFGTGVEKIFYVLGGLAAAYLQLGEVRRAQPLPSAHKVPSSSWKRPSGIRARGYRFANKLIAAFHSFAVLHP